MRTLSDKIAQHEAGHAVAAAALGIEVYQASIDPAEVLYAPTADRRRELTMVLAGPAAEADLTGRRMRVEGHDDRKACSIAARLAAATGDDPARILRAAARRARELVDEPAVAASIRRVAHELLDRFDLDGAVIRAVLAEERRKWGGAWTW